MKRARVEELLESLSDRQYLHPHQPLRLAVMAVAERMRIPPAAVDASLRWLQLDSQRSIGRLRRTELAQLATSVDRSGRQIRARSCTA